DVLEDPCHPLLELRRALPRPDVVDAVPGAEADEPAGLVQVADEPQRAGAGHAARPAGELRPCLDERLLAAGVGLPGTHRVDLAPLSASSRSRGCGTIRM